MASSLTPAVACVRKQPPCIVSVGLVGRVWCSRRGLSTSNLRRMMLLNPEVNLLKKCQRYVDKKTIKTRAFQEACIYFVVDLLAKHLAKWSYSIDFFEMPLFHFFGSQAFVKLSCLTLIDLGKR
ncbi:hypothetical protein BDA96_05G150700 [Sorghum bicolor]|uniref:Uncharacterized protein n=1 Tax=Sorghum bicolor TaxID=4558 RepID=A0A921R006_SORBI|nr:hypothetical protein BDA96_05G150700 [Sorghum bicolor]